MKQKGGFQWTAQREKAAELLALDEKTDEEIARSEGVHRVTLAKWKRHPDFAARVQERLESYRETIRKSGLAIVENRILRLKRRADLMDRLIAERAADPKMQAVPGGTTGLLVHTVKGVGKDEDFQLIDLYAFDAALVKELREHEKQAAQELGQWTEKKELTGKGGGPIELSAPVLEQAAGELAKWRKQMTEMLSNTPNAAPTPPISATSTE